MSDQDILLQDRIEFLASYSETMFKEELFNLGMLQIKSFLKEIWITKFK